MSYQLNAKIQDLVPYAPTLGNYKIRLDANESFVDLPTHILEEVQQALSHVALNRYPDPLATQCCQSFGDYYSLKPELITAGNGSDELISLILGGFLQRGDKLLLTQPDFSMYGFYAHVAELISITLPKESMGSIDSHALVRVARQQQCKAVLFSNPCNPTAQGLNRQKVVGILEDLPETLVIVDEAYMDFWDQSVLDLVESYPNLLVVRTCSKAFGSAALRLGFAIANQQMTRALRALKSPYNVNGLTQAAGTVILRHPQCLKQAIAKINGSRDSLYQDLVAFQASLLGQRLGLGPLLPSQTNFLVAQFQDNQEAFLALGRQGILVRCFDQFLRITVGTPSENQALLRGLQTYGEEKV